MAQMPKRFDQERALVGSHKLLQLIADCLNPRNSAQSRFAIMNWGRSCPYRRVGIGTWTSVQCPSRADVHTLMLDQVREASLATFWRVWRSRLLEWRSPMPLSPSWDKLVTIAARKTLRPKSDPRRDANGNPKARCLKKPSSAVSPTSPQERVHGVAAGTQPAHSRGCD